MPGVSWFGLLWYSVSVMVYCGCFRYVLMVKILFWLLGLVWLYLFVFGVFVCDFVGWLCVY